MKADDAKVIYVRIPDKNVVERFDKMFPGVRSNFIYKSLIKATNSKDFLMQVLFGD